MLLQRLCSQVGAVRHWGHPAVARSFLGLAGWRGIDTGKTKRRTPEESRDGSWEDGGRKGRSSGAVSQFGPQRACLPEGQAPAGWSPLRAPRASDLATCPAVGTRPASLHYPPSRMLTQPPQPCAGAQALRLLASGSSRACACVPALESCGASWDVPSGRICCGLRGPFCARVRAWWGWMLESSLPWKREVRGANSEASICGASPRPWGLQLWLMLLPEALSSVIAHACLCRVASSRRFV